MGGTAVFVPDEEAARLLERWLEATDLRLVRDVWPGWAPAGIGFGLVLPHAGGTVLRGLVHQPGQAVAARGSGSLPGLSHVEPERGERLGLGAGDAAAGPICFASLDGQDIVLWTGTGQDTPGLARAILAAAFARWWTQSLPEGVLEASWGVDGAPASVEDVALGTLEGRLLADALGARGSRAADDAALRRWALQLALLRRERRADWSEERLEGERCLEVLLGIPEYIGRRAARTLDPHWEDRGIEDLGRLGAQTRCRLGGALLAELLDQLDGLGLEPAGPVRERTWVERPGRRLPWRDALRQDPAAGLDPLLERFVRFDGGSRDDAALAAALGQHGHAGLLEEERQRQRAAAGARESLLRQILQGPGTLLALDVSALGEPAIQCAEAPQPINSALAIYPRGATFVYGGGTRLDCAGQPVARDVRGGLVQVRIGAELRLHGDGAAVPAGAGFAFTQGLSLRAGGVRLQARRGKLMPIDGGWLVHLEA